MALASKDLRGSSINVLHFGAIVIGHRDASQKCIFTVGWGKDNLTGFLFC